MLLLFLIFLDVVYFFGFTTPGLKLGLASAAIFIPGKVSVNNIDGSLFSKFSLRDIHYQNADRDVQIETFSFQWDPDALINAQLHINKIEMGETKIILHHQQPSDAHFNFAIKKWLRFIKVDTLAIKKIQVVTQKAKIDIDGTYNQSWNLNWNIQIPQLSTLFSKTSGSFASSGHMTGSSLTPTILANIEIHNAKMAEDKINELQGKLNFSLIPNSISTLKVNAHGLRLSQHEIKNITILASENFHWEKQTFQSNLQLALNDEPILHGHLAIPDFLLKKWDQLVLDGKIDLNTRHLESITTLTPAIQNPKGILQGQLQFNGLLSHLKTDAKFNLSQGSVFIPALGITLKNINITANTDLNKILHLSGILQAGDGKANIQGLVDFSSTDFASELSIQGNDLTVSQLEHYKIIASPNLKIHFKKPQLNIDGIVHIPQAEIIPTDFGATITMPDDVVFVGQPQPEMPRLYPNLKLQITLVLGEKIKLQYKDLQASLGGKLDITKMPGNPPTAIGELYATSGTYRAYGQLLTIQHGRLIYTGNTLMNPGLNIRAAREIQTVAMNSNTNFSNTPSFQPIYIGRETITAGVDIEGTIQHPLITLFSNPSMSQNDVLSYLLLGRPQGTGNQLGLLLSATSAMNLNKGPAANVGNLTEKIQSKLGLNELSVGSTEVFDPNKGTAVSTTSFIVGKQLAKNLYLHYSVGLFNPVSILNLRYQLTKNWAIQSETSSIDNGADLVYGFERD